MNVLGRIFGRLRGDPTQRRPPTLEARLRVTNLTRHTVLATGLEVANSGSTRSKGLLGRARLAPGEGLWILPCEAVHTFFMQFPIDLVYTGPRESDQEDPKRRTSVAPVGMPYGALRASSSSPEPSATRRHSPETRLNSRLLLCPMTVPRALLPTLSEAQAGLWINRRPFILESTRGPFPEIPAQLHGAKE